MLIYYFNERLTDICLPLRWDLVSAGGSIPDARGAPALVIVTCVAAGNRCLGLALG